MRTSESFEPLSFHTDKSKTFSIHRWIYYLKLKKNSPCCLCGDASHLTAACRLAASTPETGTNGGLSPFGGPPAPSSALPWMGNPALSALPVCNGKPVKEIDEAKLFLGFLPQSVNDDRLRELFLPFGSLCEAIVIKDKSTGLSKGYGFLKYIDPIFAAKAVARMNGYRIDWKILAVRVAGRPPSTANTVMGPGRAPSFAHLPTYPGPAAFSYPGILSYFLEPLLRGMMAQWIGRVLQDLCYQNPMFLYLRTTGFYSILILSMENLKHVAELQFHLL